MKSYQASTPRAAIFIAATAMTALSFALLVPPAKTVPSGNLGPVANAPRAAGPAEGMPIVVYGVREVETAMQKVQSPHVVPPRKQQS